MKLFRILMVCVFMLSATVTTTAQAAGGQKIAFIRLLSNVDSKSSIQIQSRLAYQRIKPQLLALQKQGHILSFQPELQAGIVKVEYATSEMSATALPGYQTFDNIHDAIVTAPATRPTLQSISAQALTPMFYMSLYSSCFGASGLGASSYVIGTMRDKKNRIVSTYEGYADGAGDIYLNCFLYAGSYTNVVPGYTLSFKVYDGTSTLLGTFNVTAPAIDFTFINASRAVVRGTGPANKNYEVDWYHRNWDVADTDIFNYKFGTTSASGTWQKDMGIKFRGGDWLDIYLEQSPGFIFSHSMDVPHIYCQLGGNYCAVSGFAFKPVTLSIVRSGITYSFSGTFDSDGYFSVLLEKAGKPIFLRSGNKVSGTGVPTSFTLPSITTAINFSTNEVYGKAPANRYFELFTHTDCGCLIFSRYVNSTALKTYVADFTSDIDLVDTAPTTTQVYFVDPVTGNSIDYFHSFAP